MNQEEQPPYDFAAAVKAWSRIPVDDLDYLTADEFLFLHQEQLKALLDCARSCRWSPNLWRNKGNTLLQFMRQGEDWTGKVVMDYGCGLGLDGAAFADAGANVVLADINPKLLRVAQNTVITMTGGRAAVRLVLALAWEPWFILDADLDLFWSLGCLHHTPCMGKILERAVGKLKPSGEARILVYSDKRWERMMREPLPESPLWKHPRFAEWVRLNDSVGDYADAFGEDKIRQMVEPFAKVEWCGYLCDNEMLGVVLRRKA